MEKIPVKSRVTRINEEQIDNYLFSYKGLDYKVLMAISPNEKMSMIIDDAVDLRREIGILKLSLPKKPEIRF